MSASHRQLTACRVCRSQAFDSVLDLGETPLANAFIDPACVAEAEPRFPLQALRCTDCGLVQLSVVVNPDILFGHYLYTTSSSAPMRAHFATLAAVVAGAIPGGARVVEIGSNDGVLLRPLRDLGLRPLGIEPARNLAHAASEAGLETLNEFFSAEVARDVRASHGPAEAVLANNVLAHIDDVRDALSGIESLLSPSGIFVAEVPYLADLLDAVEYDTIYHEHLSYFHLMPLERALADAGLQAFDVERLGVHGGSIRIFAGRVGRRARSARLSATLAEEARRGLSGNAPYRSFAARVAASRNALRALLLELRSSGRRVAALGASAKGNTLLNYCDIGPDLVEWIADSTPLKEGRLSPGMRIPVRPESTILTERPDRTLLLAWNYADDIVRRFSDYIAGGGAFIHPIPLARVIP